MLEIAHLPALNATLNATCFVLLVAAVRAIKRGNVARHRALMLAACAVSAAFLASYVVYHLHVGMGRRFPELGWVRTAYLTMLATHVVLAAVQLPLVITTLVLGLRRRDALHRRWAKPTIAIWMYVSVTGVVIYVALYHVFEGAAA